MKKLTTYTLLTVSTMLASPLSLVGNDEIEKIYREYGGPRLYRFYHPLSSDRHEMEDVFNRYGGPPLYRYYHRLPSYGPHDYYGRSRYRNDANYYWGDRYYGNENPN